MIRRNLTTADRPAAARQTSSRPRSRGAGVSNRLGVPLALAAAALSLAACAPGGDARSGTQAADPEVSTEVDEEAAALLPEAVAEAGTLKAATAVGYEPYEFKDDSGNLVGLDIDLGNAIAQKLGMEVQFDEVSYDSITGAVKAGRYDLSLTGYTASAERQEQVDLIEYASSQLGILVPQGNPEGVEGRSDLCGLRVAVEKGSSADLGIQEFIDSGECGDDAIDFDVLPGQADAVSALESGRTDAVVSQNVNAGYVANTNEATKDTFDLVSDDAFEATQIAIVVGKDSGLTEAVVAALESLQEDGTFQEIFDKYGVSDAAVDGAAVNSSK
ncbi:MAG: hypothetical protein AVDCRST_MAG60-2582 [uncultured Nocardioides sp.]|uniref:Solute-binding protein family 3/N-terminal domain-containing protein n=1 Tax=uncultured Nocardioides sp. TaxID=198441 RepID=A0A6J4PAT6_9ACTN|nr:MAG: hypothetical protein AVDCRST_MAG60-2582 [uncultured Nocardioides sp.]